MIPPKPMGGIGHTGLLLNMGSRFRVPPMFHCANNGTPTVSKYPSAGWVEASAQWGRVVRQGLTPPVSPRTVCLVYAYARQLYDTSLLTFSSIGLLL